MGINNPLPASLNSECRKASRVLASFIDPRQSFGPDKIIPPSVLQNAKGLAVITVLKAGFLFSGRVGSGLVVARLADGSWSAPSAIATAGAGFGGQIGAELTDFVMILNDNAAIKTFSSAGSITLGGNVSIAAGPVGRNAEAGGAASLKGVAGIFSYSKTKGLFAGVSLEGSVIIERRDANKKFYGTNCKASSLLTGSVPAPAEADTLYRVLNSRVFRGGSGSDEMYNDIPVYDDNHDDDVWEGNRGHALGEERNSPTARRPSRASTWQDEVYDRGMYNENPNRRGSTARDSDLDGFNLTREQAFQRQHFNSTYTDTPGTPTSQAAPGRPTAPKPDFKGPSRASTLGANQAVALYTFDADQPGDLGFKKGEIITIIKRTDSKNDWWTGKIGDRTGIFPSNYVEAV
ncbi:hypothetical protein TWF569_003589 [Orbilia oligospora]|uniref:SH3 domain-containing protein n=2 Tax=Orbilia oligospora TaxID=2813651 RepID=A0A7C8JMP4_ORBOL|nr:hypothetical protein TWF102_008449 [Orbilia oligospora]KAF3109546.1 hypothetical protein TWF706_001414 [Orbilia oligospora]KAF3114694.1 hypothetical protein TWF103_000434 [Orbilia oligospora]KAF3119208.1 hypothetical protein TWF703_003598 [Orbilia oligospora]KAF3119775.1 hypothetical protein TWF569_003589 [Orbilia oligospora]